MLSNSMANVASANGQLARASMLTSRSLCFFCVAHLACVRPQQRRKALDDAQSIDALADHPKQHSKMIHAGHTCFAPKVAPGVWLQRTWASAHAFFMESVVMSVSSGTCLQHHQHSD